MKAIIFMFIAACIRLPDPPNYKVIFTNYSPPQSILLTQQQYEPKI
jgi:hypothetical protein